MWDNAFILLEDKTVKWLCLGIPFSFDDVVLGSSRFFLFCARWSHLHNIHPRFSNPLALPVSGGNPRIGQRCRYKGWPGVDRITETDITLPTYPGLTESRLTDIPLCRIGQSICRIVLCFSCVQGRQNRVTWCLACLCRIRRRGGYLGARSRLTSCPYNHGAGALTLAGHDALPTPWLGGQGMGSGMGSQAAMLLTEAELGSSVRE